MNLFDQNQIKTKSFDPIKTIPKEQKAYMTQNTSKENQGENVISIKKSEIEIPSASLTTKDLFKHFFLLHDYFFRLVKVKAKDGQYFDLQMDVNDSMVNAARNGGRFSQMVASAGLILYCVKGNSLSLRFVYGFLWMYWISHFYTLGSYLGVALRMPSLYKKTGEYFLNNSPLDKNNVFLNLNEQMQINSQGYEETLPIIDKIFNEKQADLKSYTANDYFIENKEKYFNEESGVSLEKPNLKLKYFDSFPTRYVYYNFSRWFFRLGLYLGINAE